MKTLTKAAKHWKGLSLAIVAIILLISFAAGGNGGHEVEACTVAVGDILETIPASGKIRPVVEISVSPDVSGEIVKIYFKEGEMVHRGDTILKIKQDLYLSIVERAEAALGSMKAELHRQEAGTRQAEQNLERCSRLLKDDAVSRAEYEKAESDYEIACEQLAAAECNVRSGEASLREAKENLTKTVVISPMDGTVSKMNVSPGERVVGTSQMAGTEMLWIADLSGMEIVSDVSEGDVVRISEGDSAEIVADAYPNLIFNGLVTHIANSSKFIATGLGQVANFEVRIAILPQDSTADGKGIQLKPGMSATVSIMTEKRCGVATIPLQSIFQSGKKETVWRIGEGGKVSAATIETGIQDLNRIEVKAGLRPGDTIVSGPYTVVTETLKEGDKVRILNID